jgi:hypothetical protein
MWSFERGSRPYDVICIVILSFIFLTPHSAFNDRPKPTPASTPPSDPAIRQTNLDDGHLQFVVQVETEQDVNRLKASLGEAATISRTEPHYDSAGHLVGYWIWIQR